MTSDSITTAALFPFGTALVALYDGHCGLCRRSAAWLQVRDRAHRLNLVPLQTDGVLAYFHLSAAEAEGEMHVFSADGEHYAGADGVLHAVAQLPRYRLLRPLWSLPGVLPIARIIYRQVAKRRRRGCVDGVCRLH